MAWAGLTFGVFGGLLASVLGYSLWSLPLWMSLALYPLIGTLIVFVVLAVLILRGRPHPPHGALLTAPDLRPAH